MLLLNQIVSFSKLLRGDASKGTSPVSFLQKPPDNGNLLPNLSKTEVQAQLTRKFKEVTHSFDAKRIRERLLSPGDIQDDDNDEYFIEENDPEEPGGAEIAG